jgi:hypothetical protein
MQQGKGTAVGKSGDNREQRAKIKEAKHDGKAAGDAGLSTGANRQIGHGQQPTTEELHSEKGKT